MPAVVVSATAHVVRDVEENGSAVLLAMSSLLRTSPTFIRLGSAQLHARRRELSLATHALEHAERVVAEWSAMATVSLPGAFSPCAEDQCSARLQPLLVRAARRLATSVAAWHAYGFVHGVMNTDNLSPVGWDHDRLRPLRVHGSL